MPPIPALAREEWPDADFDLPDGVPITAPSDRDDEIEDWDSEMNLGQTGGAKAQADIAGIAARSDSATTPSLNPNSPYTFTIRPPITSTGENDDDDEGVSTIKALSTLKIPAAATTATEEDFEDGFSLPSDLTQLSLAPLSLNHRSSKNSLEWGDKDQTSSSQSSDAYSTLGFADASPSSNSASSISSLAETETETEEEDDQDDLEGLIIPAAIFDGSGSRMLKNLLELKKKASYTTQRIKVARPNPEDDFEAGLVFDDDEDLSPSRLLQKTQNQRLNRHFERSTSAPLQHRSPPLRAQTRIRSETTKSPTAPPQSSARQLHKLRLSPSPPLLPPRSQTSFGALWTPDESPSPAPASPLLVPKPGSLRGQKSHAGLKPPTPTATRKLTRKASLSSLMEMSHANASEAVSSASGPRVARYEVHTAASLAKVHKSFTENPSRSNTPSHEKAAHRLTMPAQMRPKSRPSLSQVFADHGSQALPSPGNRTASPSPTPPKRPPSRVSLRRANSRALKNPTPHNTPAFAPTTPPAPKLLKRPKKQKTYGNGTELDAFDDLPTDRDKESQYRVQPKGYGNRVPGASYPPPQAASEAIHRKKRAGSTSIETELPPAPNVLRRPNTRIESLSKPSEPLPKKKRVASASCQAKRKPTLIRNLGGASASKVVGDMKWNPKTLRWEGNDQALKAFDAAVASSTRPALITHLTGSSIGSPVGSFTSGARRVGNMIFDPHRMSWISALPPDDDEPDVFANLADDENESELDLREGTIRANMQRAPSEAGSTSTVPEARLEPASPARSLNSYGVSDSESDRGSRASLVVCDIDDTFVAICKAAEERHRVEIKGWRTTLSRRDVFSTPDRSHLYEVRALATRRY